MYTPGPSPYLSRPRRTSEQLHSILLADHHLQTTFSSTPRVRLLCPSLYCVVSLKGKRTPSFLEMARVHLAPPSQLPFTPTPTASADLKVHSPGCPVTNLLS